MRSVLLKYAIKYVYGIRCGICCRRDAYAFARGRHVNAFVTRECSAEALGLHGMEIAGIPRDVATS